MSLLRSSSQRRFERSSLGPSSLSKTTMTGNSKSMPFVRGICTLSRSSSPWLDGYGYWFPFPSLDKHYLVESRIEFMQVAALSSTGIGWLCWKIEGLEMVWISQDWEIQGECLPWLLGCCCLTIISCSSAWFPHRPVLPLNAHVKIIRPICSRYAYQTRNKIQSPLN